MWHDKKNCKVLLWQMNVTLNVSFTLWQFRMLHFYPLLCAKTLQILQNLWLLVSKNRSPQFSQSYQVEEKATDFLEMFFPKQMNFLNKKSLKMLMGSHSVPRILTQRNIVLYNISSSFIKTHFSFSWDKSKGTKVLDDYSNSIVMFSTLQGF